VSHSGLQPWRGREHTRAAGLPRETGGPALYRAKAAEEVSVVEWPVALKYPNGRVHETTIDAAADFGPGYEFEAFGRRWRVLARPRGSRRPAEPAQTERLVCRYIGPTDES